MRFVITIDGPAAAGKSTTAREVASRLGYLYVDTGALYRALALKVRRAAVTPDDPAAVAACARASRLGLAGTAERPRVLLDGQDVTDEIRTPEVSELASRLAAHREVRACLVECQRALAEGHPVVAEGRDLGTVVFPQADVKIYLDADLETRARRRYRELTERGIAVALEEARQDLARRDERDRGRRESPLAVPPGAVVVDGTRLSVEEQVEAVLAAVAQAGGRPVAERRAGG
jgi:cytidylate kinase